MDFLSSFWDLLLWGLSFFNNLDDYVKFWSLEYGHYIYLIVFIIIYCETGLVITPFLPGDSLLFLLGTLAGASLINPFAIMAIIVLAALLGDTTNFWVGNFFRDKIDENTRWIKQKYLHRTEDFFKRHGGKSLIMARFVPIVRTYAPFVGGLVRMQYSKFIAFNSVGAILWVIILVPAGYFLGRFEFVTNNISKMVILVILLSLFPIIYGIVSEKLVSRKIKKKYKEIQASKSSLRTGNQKDKP